MPVNQTDPTPDDGDDESPANPTETDVDEAAEPNVRRTSESDDPA